MMKAIEKIDIDDMKHDIEMYFAFKCMAEQEKKGNSYKCECPDPFKWSNEKIVEFYNKYVLREKYKEMTCLLGLSKKILSKLSGDTEKMIRYDSRMPKKLKLFLSELYEVFIFASEQFDGDKEKTSEWFIKNNSLLGNVTPLQMVITGKTKKLHRFVERSLNGDMP